MQVTIDIPDRIAQKLNLEAGNLSHQLLEILVSQAYGSGKITTSEVRDILQLPSRLETHAFLKKMGVYLNYDEAELEQDIQTLKQLRAK